MAKKKAPKKKVGKRKTGQGVQTVAQTRDPYNRLNVRQRLGVMDWLRANKAYVLTNNLQGIADKLNVELDDTFPECLFTPSHVRTCCHAVDLKPVGRQKKAGNGKALVGLPLNHKALATCSAVLLRLNSQLDNLSADEVTTLSYAAGK